MQKPGQRLGNPGERDGGHMKPASDQVTRAKTTSNPPARNLEIKERSQPSDDRTQDARVVGKESGRVGGTKGGSVRGRAPELQGKAPHLPPSVSTLLLVYTAVRLHCCSRWSVSRAWGRKGLLLLHRRCSSRLPKQQGPHFPLVWSFSRPPHSCLNVKTGQGLFIVLSEGFRRRSFKL